MTGLPCYVSTAVFDAAQSRDETPSDAVNDFAIRNLSVLSYAQGFTSWHYRHKGALAEVLAPGFFNPAADMLADGDMMMISANKSGAHVLLMKESHHAPQVDVAVMARTP